VVARRPGTNRSRFTNESEVFIDCAVGRFKADGELFHEFPARTALNGKLPVLPLTRPIQSVRHAPDLPNRNNKSDKSGDQQQGTALDGHQDADSENGAHSDPNRERPKQFHGTDLTGLFLRFNNAFLRTEWGLKGKK